MSADGSDYAFTAAHDRASFKGLEGVDELVNSKGLELLRGKIEASEVRALIDLAKIVADHEAATGDIT